LVVGLLDEAMTVITTAVPPAVLHWQQHRMLYMLQQAGEVASEEAPLPQAPDLPVVPVVLHLPEYMEAGEAEQAAILPPVA